MNTTLQSSRAAGFLKRGRGYTLAAFATTTAALALVIWIKLRVVSNLPKQAYAEPAASVDLKVTR